mgnify:CR=1 FL=1
MVPVRRLSTTPIAPEGPPLPVLAGKGADAQGLLPLHRQRYLRLTDTGVRGESGDIARPILRQIKYQPPDRQ